MEKSKIETYLGFCIRSGTIIFGTEMINSFKIMVKAKETLACPLIQTETGALGALVHRPSVKAVAIKDEHLASAILKEIVDAPQFKLYSGGNN